MIGNVTLEIRHKSGILAIDNQASFVVYERTKLRSRCQLKTINGKTESPMVERLSAANDVKVTAVKR